MSTKVEIYNLALSALMLTREISDIDTDTSNEVRTLNIHWKNALKSTLKDLDLTILSRTMPLELITELTEGPWTYVYKYPTDCAKFRRIVSPVVTDNIRTHISKKVALYNDQKAIFTNEYQAEIEYIPNDVPLLALSPMAEMALAYRLAYLSAPLIVGKGSKPLRDSLQAAYLIAKSEACEDDASENFVYETEDVRSEFVNARLE